MARIRFRFGLGSIVSNERLGEVSEAESKSEKSESLLSISLAVSSSNRSQQGFKSQPSVSGNCQRLILRKKLTSRVSSELLTVSVR